MTDAHLQPLPSISTAITTPEVRLVFDPCADRFIVVRPLSPSSEASTARRVRFTPRSSA